jgi:hypothetical protein
MQEEKPNDPTVQVCCAVRIFVVNASGVATVLSLSSEQVIVPNNLAASSPVPQEPGTSNLAQF